MTPKNADLGGRSVPPKPEANDFDPTWWAPAYSSGDLPEFDAADHISLRLEELTKAAPEDTFQREVLTALARTTSAMLLEDSDWNEPFTPAIVWGGRRSPIPSDLEDDQIALLAQLASEIPQADLRARVADVAWTCGDRSQVALLDLAVDAYRSAPLTTAVWVNAGKAGWQRAFDLLGRRGSDGTERREQMQTTLRDHVLGATSGGLTVADVAGVLRNNARPDTDTCRKIADHLVTLAANNALTPRVQRHLEREAAAWFRTGPEATVCIEREARSYIAEADAFQATGENVSALAESLSIDKALAVLRRLPRAYRLANGIEDLISELRERLDDAREQALEAMESIPYDPIDLTSVISEAQEAVTGKGSAWEALVAFATLSPPLDAEQTRESSAKVLEGGISHIFQSTTFSGDRRKVAVRPGSGGAPDDPAVEAQVIQHVFLHAQAIAFGQVLPAHAVLQREHRYDRTFLTGLCQESPFVPQGHAGLWAGGLALGMNSEYGLGCAILVPQLEHAIRAILKQRRVFTLTVDETTGVETEKGLGALLDMPQTEQLLGAGQVMEFKALLVTQGAANMRNDIAHGLYSDPAASTPTAAYVWWSCLRLIVRALILAAHGNGRNDASTTPTDAQASNKEETDDE